MKPTLCAAALAGAFLCGGAWAQSSITIYGAVDLSVARANGGTAPNQGAPARRTWSLQQSHASRLGFRGHEDLGGGNSVQFQLEHRFNPDTGTVTNPEVFWHGRSYVQLTNATLGSLYLGREFAPVFFQANKTDPFAWDGVGKADMAMYGANGVGGYRAPNAGGVRLSNGVGYKTPNLHGFTSNIATSLSEGSAAGRVDSVNVQYNQGPVFAGLGYETVANGSARGQGLANLGFSYDFGAAKLMLYAARARWGQGGDSHSRVLSVGGQIPLGQGRLKLLALRVDPDGASNDSAKLGIGYDYFLSKRTALYADAGFGRMDTRTDSQALALGMKHSF